MVPPGRTGAVGILYTLGDLRDGDWTVEARRMDQKANANSRLNDPRCHSSGMAGTA